MNAMDIALPLIARFEGFRADAYQDEAGVWTIGYGTTVWPEGVGDGPVKRGDKITHDVAMELLRTRVERDMLRVAELAQGSTAHERAAMTSLAYNIGMEAFRNSSVLRNHRMGRKQSTAQSFKLWCKVRVSGVLRDSKGLLRRREEEAKVYLTPDDRPWPSTSA